ncbi:MAG: DHH family phosphoesterase [Candidatus Falkowbacteria bacterium]
MISQEQQIFNQIDRAQNILLTFASDWNGDSLGSAMAFYLFLKKIGKNVEIAADNLATDNSRAFSFLPGFSEIQSSLNNLAKFIVSLDITNAKVDQIKYVVEENHLNFIISPKEGWFNKDDVSTTSSGYKYDLIIILGSPDLESLGKIYDNHIDFFYKTTIVNIDHNHHNEEFGQVNFIELNAVATAEILFELLKDYKEDLIDADIATCLLCGIICKTRSFKTGNLSPHALTVTSELMTRGGRREEIVNKLYRSRDFNTLKLWGKILNNIQQSGDSKIIWSVLNDIDLGVDFKEDSLAGVLEELIVSVPQAKALVVFYQQKALVYAAQNINCLDLAKEFSPTGGRRMAYIDLGGLAVLSPEEVINSMTRRLDKLISQ